MDKSVLNLIDYKKVNILLEGFNKTTGFVTAILDLEGNVLSKSGWRQICTEFHRIHPETAKRCIQSDTILAGQMAAGEKYYFYKCLNGLIDVAVPIIINEEHVANLFSGQFFFEKPDREFFENQAKKYKFDSIEYLNALDKVPVVSEEKVCTAMDFLLNMTQLISEMTMQKVEQNELNDALRINEEKFRSVFENSLLGKSITGIDGSLQVNKSFCDILGYSKQELKTKSWQDLTHPDDISKSTDAVQELLDGKKDSIQFEKRYIHKNGSIVWTDVITALKREVDNEPEYFITSIQDITERKHAEDALRESELKYQNQANFFDSVIESSPFAMWISDAKGIMIRANQALRNTLNLSDDMLIGKYNVLYDKNLNSQGFMSIVKAVFNDLKSIRFTMFWAGTEAGDVDLSIANDLWIDVSMFPIIDEDGILVNVVCQYVDITEQKKAEEEINKLTLQLKETGKMAKIGGWEFDANTGKGTWTEEVARIYDLDPDEPTSMEKGISFYTPESKLKIEKAIKNAIDNNIPYDFELEMITAKGNRKWVHTIGKPTQKDGKVIRVHGSFQEITDMKKIEHKLRQHQELLEKLVLERTSSLNEKNEELERMNKLFIGRELKMVELKEKIKSLQEKMQK